MHDGAAASEQRKPEKSECKQEVERDQEKWLEYINVTCACQMEGSDLTSQRLFHDEIHGDSFISPRLPDPSSVPFTGG